MEVKSQNLSDKAFALEMKMQRGKGVLEVN